jgi:hypothetical protein
LILMYRSHHVVDVRSICRHLRLFLLLHLYLCLHLFLFRRLYLLLFLHRHLHPSLILMRRLCRCPRRHSCLCLCLYLPLCRHYSHRLILLRR